MATSNARQIAGTLYDALVGEAVEQLRGAAKQLSSTQVSGEPLADQVRAALGPNALPQVQNFVLGLAKEGLLNQLAPVADALEIYGQTPSAAQLDAEVTSASVLSAEQQARITSDLVGRYGEGLVVTFTVDESLIGGLIIRVGDQVLDNSLRARLGAVQRNMLAS